jgi:AraC-like DNA-binding protein
MEAPPAESWKRRLLDALPLAPPQSESGVARNLFEVLHLLVAMIDASRSGDKNEGDEKWLHRARRAISKSLEDGTGPLAAGAVLGEASAEAFRKRFTRLQGCSPSQYRFQLQVEQASLLLRSGGMGLKQIASRLGFHDEFHFSKRFKAATGLSPSDFRKL